MLAMKRIEVESLKHGDVFEYEYDTIDYDTIDGRLQRVGWKTEVKRDTLRSSTPSRPSIQICPVVIADRKTSPNLLRGGWHTPEDAAEMEHVHLIPFEDMPRRDWWGKNYEGRVWVEPGELFKDGVLLETRIGENNHGYVWRKPKDVVVLIEEGDK